MSSHNFLLLAIVFLLISCNNQPVENTGTVKEVSSAEKSASTDGSSKDCDPGLWKYVYNSDRLQVLDKCKSVTGTIVETNADEDGDQHMLLKLEQGEEKLLTERNMKKKDGNLVIEAVCINNITRKKAFGACDGYVNNVQLPKVGDHVKVTGSYVIDSHNGWAEIHPITSIVNQ